MEINSLESLGLSSASLSRKAKFIIKDKTSKIKFTLVEHDYNLIVATGTNEVKVYEDFDDLSNDYFLVDELFYCNLDNIENTSLKELMEDKTIGDIVTLESIDFELVAYEINDDYVAFNQEEQSAVIIPKAMCDRIKVERITTLAVVTNGRSFCVSI
jgi:hypothetical protein